MTNEVQALAGATGSPSEVLAKLEAVRDPEIQRRVMASMGRIGGRLGGKARAEKLSPARRSEIAREAAAKRWGKPVPAKIAPDPAQLLVIADQIDAEAVTWKEGFAVASGSGKRRKWTWPNDTEYPWARARVEKLESHSAYLRSLVNDKGQS